MHATNSASANKNAVDDIATNSASANKNAVDDIAVDGYPFIRVYKDGRIERLLRSPFVPSSEDPAANRGVATRDVVIDPSSGVSARLFLPSGASATGRRLLPVVVYFHGGSFCTESAFCRTYHSYASSVASRAGALVVSVEYRLAPEHPVPAAYDDAWAAVRWVASLSDPWLADHADPRRMFLAGDSAGGNIAFHTAVRASRDGDVGTDVEGLVMVQPYLWGAWRLPSETVWDGTALLRPEAVDMLWPFVTAGQAGNEDPRIDPPVHEIASLTCRRVLLAVAGRDILRYRGRRLVARMRGCGWTEDDVTLVESEGEDHGFHLYSPLRATSKKLMQSIVQFINQAELQERSTWHAWEGKTSRVTMDPGRAVISVPTRPYSAILVDELGMEDWGGPRSTRACNALALGRGKASKARYGLYSGQLKPSNGHRNPSAAPVLWRSVMKNFY